MATRKNRSDLEKLLADLPRKSVAALHDEQDKWYSYKFASLFHALAEVTLSGDYVELGVYKGRCANFLLPLLRGGRKLHLFDSFTGLPEDWLGPWTKGAFSLPREEIPNFESQDVFVHTGMFSETLPRFSERQATPLALIHLDADLYSSTLEALSLLDRIIAPGTVLLFDEYFMEHKGDFSDDEHAALLDWSNTFNRRFKYLWRTEGVQVAVRVIE